MQFNDQDVDWLSDLLSAVALQEIMPRFRQLGTADIKQKTSALDLVTEADTSAERIITARLRERYPDAFVLGEEACELDASLLSKLKDAPLAFIIDPVDGTYNFATGVPLFGVMLAVVVNGETVAGIIHDPVGKDWIIGVKGAGSHIRSAFNVRHKVSVSPPTAVNEMLGAISWQFLSDPLRSTLARNHAKCKASFGFRCAAHEYRLIASGNAHFAIFNKLMPWDHRAGVLIHQEAGGHAARFDGSAYLPKHLDGGLLIAPDKANWQDLRQILWSE